MPLHDWTRVPDNVFHAFHVHWLSTLAGELNESVLPPGYFARPEEYVGTFQTDILTVELEGGSEPPLGGSTGTVPLEPTVTIAPPRLGIGKDRRIAVFSAADERRVAVIEVASPGNKDSERRARTLEEKILVCLASGLHALLIDLLPPTAVARGFAAAVARELGSEEVPEEGRCATSFEVGSEPSAVRVYHRSLRLGDSLRNVPLFLASGRFVDVPLDQTYENAFRRMPAPDRSRMERL